MSLKHYVDRLTPAERKAFCDAAKISQAYLSQLMYGVRRPGPLAAKRISHATRAIPSPVKRPRVPLAALRPDLWAE